jgi:hypothetical protein
MSQERGLEERREDAREHDGQRQRRGERDEEGRNTLADPASHDLLVDDDDGGHHRTLAALVPGRSDLVALIVGFVRATAKSRRAASAEHSGCCVVCHTYHDAGAMQRLPGLASFGL